MFLASFRRTLPLALLSLLIAPAVAQNSLSDQIQIAPPMRQVPPPSPTASAMELEKQGDVLRAEKHYLDAVDYYHAALEKAPQTASIYNKLGICDLMLQRFKEAGKEFERAIKDNRSFAEAFNNMGVIEYERHKYHGAIKEYKKALTFQPDSASFYSNLGAAYFAKKDFERATGAYTKAVQLDPDIFDRTSHSGIAAQMASPEDRAHYDYVLAKLYAKIGDRDHSLEFLRKSMEEGYKGVKDVYTDPEFADLRKDSRFAELMKSKPLAIPE
ncbi:MAG TPA: tetratricopeptide repeat protein [Terriglobales bacterium]|nr:tetratricopeptide repeat protein [Terriglobales bacterium]